MEIQASVAPPSLCFVPDPRKGAPHHDPSEAAARAELRRLFSAKTNVYIDTDNDPLVNDQVGRHAADSGALDYLRRNQELTGELQRPVLAVHTLYDPVVPPWIPNAYAQLTRSKGAGDRFVQQYVKADGHCNITGAETLAALEELRAWKESGGAPKAGWLDVPKPQPEAAAPGAKK